MGSGAKSFDILGQILRDILGGASGTVPGMPRTPQTQLGLVGGAGEAVFGDQFEAGRKVDQSHLNNIQSVFDRFNARQP